jgi:hypothetical protein
MYNKFLDFGIYPIVARTRTVTVPSHTCALALVAVWSLEWCASGRPPDPDRAYPRLLRVVPQGHAEPVAESVYS